MRKADFIEQRNHIRVYFHREKILHGKLINPATNQPINCKIWGLSMGGLRLSIDEEIPFDKGDKLTLTNVSSANNTISSSHIELEIGWGMMQPENNRLFLGCRFTLLPEDSREAFSNIIRDELSKK